MKKLLVSSDSAAQMVVDYINAANQVSSYAASISSTTLPVLAVPPVNYGNFVQTFAAANLDVLVWIDEVLPDFNQLPKAFTSYNALFQQQVSAISGYLNLLKNDPGNGVILTDIKNAINTLVSQAAASKQTLSGTVTALSTYQNSISPDARLLAGLCQQISTAENADAASIAKLNAVLANLQQVVDDRNELITLNTLANIDEGIFIAMIGVALGVVFTGTPGLIVGIGFGIGSAVFTTLVPVGVNIDYQETLQDIQNTMDSVNTEIGLVNTTVGLLQNLSGQFNAIVTNSSIASSNMQTIVNFWEQLLTDLNDVVTELADTLQADGSNIDQAIADLSAAASAWNNLDGYMQNLLPVTFQVNKTVSLAQSVNNVINAHATNTKA